MQTNQLKIDYLPLDGLIPYARNSRTHSDEQVAQIAASIREFGFTNPVLIDEDGGIIAGHGRVLASRKLQLTDVPCITLAGLTPAQKSAYVIADNKLALNAGWDFEMLSVEIDGLNDAGYDVSLLGFSQQELNELIGTPVVPPETNEAELTDNYSEQYGVIVVCENAGEQERAYNKLVELGYNCKVVCT